MQKNSSIYFFFVLLLAFNSVGLKASAEEAPKVGRRAAARYFEKNDAAPRKPAAAESDDQLLMIGVGTYIGSKSYGWKGADTRDNIGRANYGLTYLFDHWHGMDVNLRADFAEFKLDDDQYQKLSLLPLLTFPGSFSRFPLYFGLGAGLGVFFKQAPGYSNLSLDYQLVAGARFMDLFENFGFFFEFAMKNHLHILSGGQFNGNAITAGGVFSF